ncbi:hypothetical protein ACTWQB_11950 [Piscibacillus sp. B03]|uniref:hypothetical protein n=1 Tax=Piscibacillus sp. B03 TaxID=3457430 RepID=UPI003FCD6B03
MNEHNESRSNKKFYNILRGTRNNDINGEEITSFERFEKLLEKVGKIELDELKVIADKIPNFNTLAEGYFNTLSISSERYFEILGEQNKELLKQLERAKKPEEEVEILYELKEFRKESQKLTSAINRHADKLVLGGGVMLAVVLKA